MSLYIVPFEPRLYNFKLIKEKINIKFDNRKFNVSFKAGDVVLFYRSHENQAICAYGVVTASNIEYSPDLDFGFINFKNFETHGPFVDVRILDKIDEEILTMQELRRFGISMTSGKKIGKTHDFYEYFTSVFNDKETEDFDDGEKAYSIQQVLRRNNQYKFRRKVFKEYPNECIVCKANVSSILQACHIKPYNCCSKTESEDVRNGIIMCPTHHKMFDDFLFTIEENLIIVSKSLTNKNRDILGLKDDLRVKLANGHKAYMIYHNKEFKRKNS